MRNVVPLAVLIASTFGLTLYLLVRGQSGGDSLRDAASALAVSVAPGTDADASVHLRQSSASATTEPPRADATPLAQSQRAGDEGFTAQQIAQLIAADPEFGRAIAAMLDDPDPEIRRNAAELFNAYLSASDTPAGDIPRPPD